MERLTWNAAAFDRLLLSAFLRSNFDETVLEIMKDAAFAQPGTTKRQAGRCYSRVRDELRRREWTA